MGRNCSRCFQGTIVVVFGTSKFWIHDLSILGYLVSKNFVPIGSLLMIFGKHSSNQLLKNWGDLRGFRYPQLILIKHKDQFSNIIRLERTESKDHPVENNTQ